jgi:hypothetical protein
MKISNTTKKNYSAPKFNKVGSVAKLTLKTGSIQDANGLGFI